MNNNNVHKGIVLWGTKNIYKVVPYEENIRDIKYDTSIECRVKGKRGNIEKEHTFLLAGDWVLYQNTDEGFGLITERLPRKNSMLRRKHDGFQPITVNIDVLLIVSSVKNPPFRPRFIDRILYIARCERIAVYLILNKIDLLSDEGDDKHIEDSMPMNMKERISIYNTLELQTLYTSVMNNQGIETIQNIIKEKYVGIIGQSGVGKSSLINMLVPKANRETGIISKKYDRGRHITTRPELIYGADTCLIDTPGIRELYPQETDITTLIEGYPDIFQFSAECKLPNCSHRNEPACAVMPRIGKEIYKDRYDSYIAIREDMEHITKTQWQRKKR